LPLEFIPNTPGGQFSGNGINASGTFMVASPGEYSIQYTLAGECGSTTEADLTIHPTPDASFEVFPVTGCVPYNFEATGTGGQSVLWSFVQPTGVVIPSSELTEASFTLHDAGCGELSRTVTSTMGCVGLSQSVGICGSPSPASGFSISPEAPSRFEPWVNATSTWSVEDSMQVTWVWQFQESLNIEGTNASQSFNLLTAPADPAVICLTVTDSIECATTTCKSIPFVDPIDFFAPSAFTPDHDGINDAWQAVPTGFEPHEVLLYECLIFNRWGQIVFKSQDLNVHWIGNDQNGDFFAEDGVYTFLIRLRLHDGRRIEKTGAIRMIR
jgi:gliding motility-associated-like protein